jgi:hypothetical protein
MSLTKHFLLIILLQPFWLYSEYYCFLRWNIYTRWFKYDRDYLCVNKSQFVPVISEPPCIHTHKYIYTPKHYTAVFVFLSFPAALSLSSLAGCFPFYSTSIPSFSLLPTSFPSFLVCLSPFSYSSMWRIRNDNHLRHDEDRLVAHARTKRSSFNNLPSETLSVSPVHRSDC